MKPDRLFKKLGAAIATGLIALGLIAGTAAAASAGGVSGEVSRAGGVSGEVSTAGGVSGEVSGVSGEVSGDDVVFAPAVSGEVS